MYFVLCLTLEKTGNFVLCYDSLPIYVIILSVIESLARGKPLIAVPFFGDQPSNAALVINSGSGVKLSREGKQEKNNILHSHLFIT